MPSELSYFSQFMNFTEAVYDNLYLENIPRIDKLQKPNLKFQDFKIRESEIPLIDSLKQLVKIKS